MSRTAAWTLSLVLMAGGAVVPCAAADKASPNPSRKAASSSSKLTTLSPASHRLLATAARADRQEQQPTGAVSSPGAFFKSKRGAVTLALMGAGAGFALWSIQHDRKPVKSPVR
jgi:hypothetical protein